MPIDPLWSVRGAMRSFAHSSSLHSCTSRDGGKNAIPEEPDFSGRLYAARILLLVDSEPDWTARHIGFTHRPLLPVNLHYFAGALQPQKAGHSLQLDASLLRGIPCRLRWDAPHGSLDSLDSLLLVRRRVESRDG